MVYYKRSYSTKNRKRLRKRDWSASIGGFGLKAGFSYKAKRSLAKRALTSTVTNIVRRNLETPQHFVLNDQYTNLLANTHYTYNLLSGIPQGDTNGSRMGDTIHLDSIKFKNVCIHDATSDSDIVFRLLIVKSREHVLSTPAWGSGLGSPDLYINLPVNNPATYGIIDPKKCTVVYDGEYKIRKSLPGNSVKQVATQSFSVPFDHKFIYETGTAFGKMYCLYAVISASQTGASTGTTPLGTFIMNADLIFKNSK